jgi:hypothetical protein
MTQRTIRERLQGRPLTQRLEALESSSRSLSLRANPGVLRTARSDANVTPPDPAVWSQVLSLNVTSGRWNVLAQASIYKPTSTTNEHFQWTVDVFDPSTGEALALAWKNLSIQQWRVDTSGSIIVPICYFGDFTAETNEVQVALLIQDLDAAATAYEVSAPCLTLIPM